MSYSTTFFETGDNKFCAMVIYPFFDEFIIFCFINFVEKNTQKLSYKII